VQFKRVDDKSPQNGFDKQITFLRTMGNAGANQNGAHGFQLVHDEAGRVTDEMAVDPEGNYELMKGGYAGYHSTYNEHGNETSREYRGPHGGKVLTDDWIAGWRREYDQFGNITQQTNLDLQGNPTRDKNWVAIVRHKRDPRGHEIEAANFAPDGTTPVWHKDGYSITQTEWEAFAQSCGPNLEVGRGSANDRRNEFAPCLARQGDYTGAGTWFRG
jgi:hypothetical protein